MNQLEYKHTFYLRNDQVQARISRNFEYQRYRWDVSRHCNAEYELHFLLKGKISIEIEKSHLLLEAGQGVLILPGQYHAPLKTQEAPDRFVLSFTLSDGDLAKALQSEISGFRVFTISTDMIHECFAIFREYNVLSAYRNEKIHALLTSLVVSVLRQLHLKSSEVALLSSTEVERTDIIDNFFDEQLKNTPSAEHLAQQLYLSKRQLNRVIFQLYGMSFQEKLTKAKMDRAAWLLRTTDKKAHEIAEDVGYASEAAFYAAFRKYFQITPQKYRMREK